ncbi:MAG: hypothetical protein H6719_21150 [Sandaracinaceae bacterium]|nr:hypothetical protein [Sandaracinaceae bacterium]
MKTHRLVPVLFAVGALALGVAPVALGQESGGAAAAQSGPERFNGTWRFAGSASQGRQTIERAITRAVDGMNFITQPIATGRLRDKNPLVQRIEIQLTATNARVVFDGSRTYRGALNQWTNHTFDGETIRVQFLHRTDAIVQMFRTDGGTRRNVYRLLPDGRLRLEVTVHAGSLPRDLTYQLTYRR